MVVTFVSVSAAARDSYAMCSHACRPLYFTLRRGRGDVLPFDCCLFEPTRSCRNIRVFAEWNYRDRPDYYEDRNVSNFRAD